MILAWILNPSLVNCSTLERSLSFSDSLYTKGMQGRPTRSAVERFQWDNLWWVKGEAVKWQILWKSQISSTTGKARVTAMTKASCRTERWQGQFVCLAAQNAAQWPALLVLGGGRDYNWTQIYLQTHWSRIRKGKSWVCMLNKHLSYLHVILIIKKEVESWEWWHTWWHSSIQEAEAAGLWVKG